MRIPGRWREGFVLDYHTVSSTYIGDDEFGHPLFENVRSEVGELLYRLKYRNDLSVLSDICEAVASFIEEWKPRVDLIVPVPPSTARVQQPLMLIAKILSEKTRIPLAVDAVVRKREAPALKNIYAYEDRRRILDDLHAVNKAIVSGKRVLLVDDLYRSGATLNAITDALYSEGEAVDVFALAITRTRSNR